MISYTQRIEANEKEISELVEKKKNTEDPGALKEIMADIKRKHDELEKISADRNAEYLHMRFHHPEKGDLAERKYSRYTVKSVSEMERDFTLDGRLDRVKKAVALKFPIPESQIAKEMREHSPFKRHPATEQSDESEHITLKK